MSVHRPSLTVLLLVLASLLGESQEQQQPTFVVTGTVEGEKSTRAGTEVQVTISEATVSPKAVGNLVGQQVTILTGPRSHLRKGADYTFYAVGESAGDTLTLREVQHAVGRTDFHPSVLPASVSTRIVTSDLVVEGTILSIDLASSPSSEMVNDSTSIGPQSEHRSKPVTVRVQIKKVVSGAVTEPVIPVVVETSDDIAHVSGEGGELGKLEVGETDVFALRWNSDDHVWEASKPADVQPDNRMDSVVQVLASADAISKKKPASTSTGNKLVSDPEIAAAKSLGKVWVNLATGLYLKGGRLYGRTKNGIFMSENDAKTAGFKKSEKD